MKPHETAIGIHRFHRFHTPAVRFHNGFIVVSCSFTRPLGKLHCAPMRCSCRWDAAGGGGKEKERKTRREGTREREREGERERKKAREREREQIQILRWSRGGAGAPPRRYLTPALPTGPAGGYHFKQIAFAWDQHLKHHLSLSASDRLGLLLKIRLGPALGDGGCVKAWRSAKRLFPNCPAHLQNHTPGCRGKTSQSNEQI